MTKRIIFSMFVIMFLAFGVVSPVGAQSTDPVEPLTPVPVPDDTGVLVNESPVMGFVELAGLPTVEGASINVVDAEHTAFRAQAEKAGIVYTERYSFSTLFNGFSISIKSSEIGKISRLPGVKNVYPVEIIAMPETFESDIDPDLFSSLNMIGATATQSELGFTGKGVKVAVMDTGIDVNHPAFGGDDALRPARRGHGLGRRGIDAVGREERGSQNDFAGPGLECAGVVEALGR